MLVAQILCTNAFYKQVEAERQNPNTMKSTEETVVILQKMVDALKQEIENVQKSP